MKVTVGNREINMVATADTPRMYRMMFNRDIFKDLRKLDKAVSDDNIGDEEMQILENIAYIFAVEGEGLKEPIDKWLKSFSFFDFYRSIGSIIDVFTTNTMTTATDLDADEKKR